MSKLLGYWQSGEELEMERMEAEERRQRAHRAYPWARVPGLDAGFQYKGTPPERVERVHTSDLKVGDRVWTSAHAGNSSHVMRIAEVRTYIDHDGTLRLKVCDLDGGGEKGILPDSFWYRIP